MSNDTVEKKIPKKRGRKPKGGKIVTQNVSSIVKNEIVTNVVLHLKCKKKDIENKSFTSGLNYNPNVEHIESYSLEKNSLTLTTYSEDTDIELNNNIIDNDTINENEMPQYSEKNIKTIWKKLKILEHDLHNNNIGLQKPACFGALMISIPQKYIYLKIKVKTLIMYMVVFVAQNVQLLI